MILKIAIIGVAALAAIKLSLAITAKQAAAKAANNLPPCPANDPLGLTANTPCAQRDVVASGFGGPLQSIFRGPYAFPGPAQQIRSGLSTNGNLGITSGVVGPEALPLPQFDPAISGAPIFARR